MLYTLLLSIISFLLTYKIISKLYPYLSSSIIDIPNDRSSHNNPTPSGAGISFVIVSCMLTPFLKSNLMITCLPLAILGFLDDKYTIPSKIRYLAQLITGLLLIFSSPNFTYLTELKLVFSLLNFTIILISITAIINFSNFMDGIDGLVVGCMINLLFFSSIINDMNLIPVVACLFAFIFWNWYPAKIFMGDSGSTYLGALYFGVILSSNNLADAIGILLIGFPLWADAFICVIRRAYKRQKIFSAHKLHLYQRLNQAGWSHSLVSSMYILFSFLLGLIYLNFGLIYLIFGCLTILIIGIFLDLKYAIPFISKKLLID